MTLRIEIDGDAVIFGVRVAPRASRNKVLGVHDSCLKVSLTAPPVDGAANAALKKLLAKLLGVPKSSITILRGATGRQKRLRVEGVEAAKLEVLAEG